MNELDTSSLLNAIRNKNKAYKEYWDKWLIAEKAKYSDTQPTPEQLEEVKRYYEAYQEMCRVQSNLAQEIYNVTSGNFSNG